MERRHEERIRAPSLSAICAPMRGNDRNVARALLDVSTSGARVLLEQPVEQGDHLLVRLLDRRSQRYVEFSGEVRWVAPLPGLTGCIAGLRFPYPHGLLDLLCLS